MIDNVKYQSRRILSAIQVMKGLILGRYDDFRSAFHIKKPHQALIETTNKCNLNCPFCMVGRQNTLVAEQGSAAHSLMKRSMGMMTPEVFERVRGELKKFGIRKVYLYFQGEPFLNVNTIPFARILKKDGYYVAIFTNGQVLTDKSITELAESELDLIRFSVHGATEETYQKNRVGGKFARVYDNMKKVVDAHINKATRIEWQFIAMRNNEHEIEKAKAMAEKIGINFFVKGFRETLPELMVMNEKYRATYLQKPCSDIYLQLGIYWDGSVVPCCYDNDAAHVMGNIVKEDLKSIWKNAKYRQFRKQVDDVRKHPEHDPIICRDCLRWK